MMAGLHITMYARRDLESWRFAGQSVVFGTRKWKAL